MSPLLRGPKFPDNDDSLAPFYLGMFFARTVVPTCQALGGCVTRCVPADPLEHDFRKYADCIYGLAFQSFRAPRREPLPSRLRPRLIESNLLGVIVTGR